MKCEMSKEGFLIISATNEIESYALSQWLKDNYPKNKIILKGKMLFDCSNSEYIGKDSILNNKL